MGLREDLEGEVRRIFATQWQKRDGKIVPEAENLQLGNHAVKFDEAVVLYADLVASTKLVDSQTDLFAAEIYKTFLHCASNVIRDNDGEITAFDGDRVMAVFIGPRKCTNAAKTALKINYSVKALINPAIKKQYESSTYTIDHAVGIDVSKILIARTGVRGSNDLVWVGRAANYAAKLCSVRDPGYCTFITPAVYNKLATDGKMGGSPERDMWELCSWTSQRGMNIYRSNWWWSF
jgi:class 3 adenylate cyclase